MPAVLLRFAEEMPALDYEVEEKSRLGVAPRGAKQDAIGFFSSKLSFVGSQMSWLTFPPPKKTH